ncbi:MAG TPA: ornithine carbamoyltransferase [Burkholderiales bacterium]|nr:ornithine carbamoyltransferase [Burkholderiales bacterium]
MTTRHLLTLDDLTAQELARVLEHAIKTKKSSVVARPLAGKVMGMIFEKSSTRTRVSFEVGMAQLGGSTVFLSPRDTHLDRGEPVEDTARVMSRMVDVIVIRANKHEMVARFAAHSNVPVINALTDLHHPCQLLADMQTWIERRGGVAGGTAAWIGDGNNVCHSWIQAARLLGFNLRVATPAGYEPDRTTVAAAGSHVSLFSDPAAAAKGADLIVTDTWASMGQEAEKLERAHAFRGFQVDNALMRLAKPDAIFMHCLPAYRGQEVAADVIDGPQSVVWDEAENRLHAQKSLLQLLLTGI